MKATADKGPNGPNAPVFLVGSGAVRNAWEPVMRAVREQGFPGITKPEGANFVLARYIYLLRFFSQGADDAAKRHVQKLSEQALGLRKDIARHLTEAQDSGETAVRDEFHRIVETFVVHGWRRVVLMTTNWDHVVDKALRGLPDLEGWDPLIHHLHGGIDEPETLYLPTEVLREPYRAQAQRDDLAQKHSRFLQALQQTPRLILYGLALSPLDAELAQFLSAGCGSSALREVYIIDPDHGVVAERLWTLLDRTKSIRVRGYHPSRLGHDDEYEYPPPATAI